MLKFLACALALASLTPVCAVAQSAASVAAPAGFAPMQAPCVKQANGTCAPVAADNPLPVAKATLPASTSTAQIGTATSTAVTPSSGTATFASGTATIGPLTPQLGREIRVVLRGTWTGTFAVSTSVDGCATLNPLTAGGAVWASFTGNANETVDTATLAGVQYCATAKVVSGSLSYTLRQ